MTWQNLQLTNEIASLAFIQKSQFVYVLAIANFWKFLNIKFNYFEFLTWAYYYSLNAFKSWKIGRSARLAELD